MSGGKEQTVGRDLTQDHFLKTLITFTIPILLANMIQLLYNTADIIILGRFLGSVGTVSISTGGDMANLVTSVGTGFTAAGQIYISQLAGAKDDDAIGKAIGSFWTFMVLISAVIMSACLIFCQPFLRLINTPQEAFPQACRYMMITNLGFPFIYMYNGVSGALRSMGESKAPLVCVTVAAISNILLDILFVAVFQMGAAGTAAATVMGQILSCMTAISYIYRRKEQFHFDFKRNSWQIDKGSLAMLLRLGIPQVAQSALLQGAQMYCLARINSYGLAASAANGIGNKINRLANVFRNSICSGASTMIGQYLGAEKPDKVKSVVHTTLAFACSFAAVNCLLALLFPEQIFGMFNSDPEVLGLGRQFLKISVISFMLSAVMGAYNAVLMASGAVMLGFLIGVLDGVVFRIGISFLLAEGFHMGIAGFFWGNCLCMLVPLVITFAYYQSGIWKRRKLLERR